jgi:pimeloyl-ACP methyl ester carboxylesterase
MTSIGAAPAAAQDSCPSPKGRLVTVAPRVKLEVVEWSTTGEPLLFLSGMARTAHAFDEFAPLLADKYRVLGITRRGWGRSSPSPSGYESTTLVADIVAVMDSLGLPATHVAGWSYGGNEAALLAVQHPERVLSVILLDAYDNSPAAATFATSDTLPGPTSRPPLHPPANLHDILEAERASGDGGKPLTEICATSRFSSTGEYLGPVTSDSVVGYLVIIGTPRLSYSAVTQPVLAIFTPIRGTEDMFPAVETMDSSSKERAVILAAAVQREVVAAETRLRRALPAARVVEIPGGSHAIFQSHPQRVLGEMRAFLADLKRDN